MDEWMDRLETGKPQVEDGSYLDSHYNIPAGDRFNKLMSPKSMTKFSGYIIGRRNVKTDATRKLDHGKLNQILPLKELPPPNHEGRSSKRPKLWKFNENSRSVWDSFRPV